MEGKWLNYIRETFIITWNDGTIKKRNYWSKINYLKLNELNKSIIGSEILFNSNIYFNLVIILKY